MDSLNVKHFPKHPVIQCFDDEINDYDWMYGYSIDLDKGENEKEIYQRMRMKIITWKHFCRKALREEIEKYIYSSDISHGVLIYEKYKRIENQMAKYILTELKSKNDLDYCCIFQTIIRNEYRDYFRKNPNMNYFKVETNL